jgi:hypothetical protein
MVSFFWRLCCRADTLWNGGLPFEAVIYRVDRGIPESATIKHEAVPKVQPRITL